MRPREAFASPRRCGKGGTGAGMIEEPQSPTAWAAALALTVLGDTEKCVRRKRRCVRLKQCKRRSK